METYITILRGINVSGKNMIKMPELLTLFEGLGFKNAKTYIQSGNVVFQHNAGNTSEFEKMIHQQIKERFSFDVPVIVKTKEYLEQTVINNPFVKRTDVDITKLHVTFLSEIPDKMNVNKINGERYLPDEFEIIDKAIYLYCPAGYGNTKLNNNFFENKLKLTATTRNWKTVNELLKIADSL